MSTTSTPVPSNTDMKARMIEKSKRFAASLGIALIIGAIYGFGLIVAVNFGGLSASWQLGFGGAIGIVLILSALYVSSHEVSGKIGGLAIGIGTLVLAVIGYDLIMPIDAFDSGDFGFGLLDIVLILASAWVINIYAGHKAR